MEDLKYIFIHKIIIILDLFYIFLLKYLPSSFCWYPMNIKTAEPIKSKNLVGS